MITQEILVDIHVLHRQGLGIRAIAKKLNLSRNTVRSYLRAPAKTPTYSEREQRPSILDPYKPYLLERIEAVSRTGYLRLFCIERFVNEGTRVAYQRLRCLFMRSNPRTMVNNNRTPTPPLEPRKNTIYLHRKS